MSYNELRAQVRRIVEERQVSLSFVVSSIHVLGNKMEQKRPELTREEIKIMIQTQPSKRFQKKLAFRVNLVATMRIYLQFGSKSERRLISGFPRCPKQLRQMRPVGTAKTRFIASYRVQSPISLPQDDFTINWNFRICSGILTQEPHRLG